MESQLSASKSFFLVLFLKVSLSTPLINLMIVGVYGFCKKIAKNMLLVILNHV